MKSFGDTNAPFPGLSTGRIRTKLPLEWGAAGDPSVDIDLDSLKAGFHAFGENGADLEHGFSLTDDKGYSAFFAFLIHQDNTPWTSASPIPSPPA